MSELGLLAGFAFLALGLMIYPLRRYFILNCFLVPLILVMVCAGYYYWGDLGGWRQYVHQQEAQAMLKSIKSPQELINKLRAKLGPVDNCSINRTTPTCRGSSAASMDPADKPRDVGDGINCQQTLDDSPKSAKGWYLLGRLYLSQGEQEQALNAFVKAYRFDPDNEQYAINYAHSLWMQNHQQFTQQMIEIFNHLLQDNPKQPDALAMMAMHAYVNQDYVEAIAYWQRLLEIAGPQSEEANAIRKAIAKAESKL